MVKFVNVSQNYGNFRALHNINFEINEGRLLALLGPNGAGKSTTMSIMTGLRPPYEGDVFINGVNIFDNPEKAKSVIGYLGEIPPLYPDLTVSEYLSFVGQLYGASKSESILKSNRAMFLLKIEERKGALIKNLSKGLKQRVGIAQSILNEPKLLVLDEPTVGLEPSQLIDFRNLIRSLALEQKMTVVLSTHIMSEASELCDDVIIINEGRKIFDGTKEELLTRQENGFMYKVVVSQCTDILVNKINAISGVDLVTVHNNVLEIHAKEDCAEQISFEIVSQKIGLKELSPKENSLENVFLRLTDKEKGQ